MTNNIKEYFYDNFFNIFLSDDGFLDDLYRSKDEVQEQYKQVEQYINSNIYIHNDIQVIFYSNNYFNLYISLVYNDVINKTKCLKVKFDSISRACDDFEFNLGINNTYKLNDENTLQHIKEITLDVFRRYSYLVFLNEYEAIKLLIGPELYESLILDDKINTVYKVKSRVNKI